MRNWIVLMLALFLQPGAFGVAQAADGSLDVSFRQLQFLPIQARLKLGVEDLGPHDLFSAAQLLLSAASKHNEELGLTILRKVTPADVPCIQYYRAEWYLRKGHPKEARTELEGFLATKAVACDSAHADLFACCPASKYRNAAGLLALAKTDDGAEFSDAVSLRFATAAGAGKAKTPMVVWQGQAFLLDTGSEHNIWNTQCADVLSLQTDKSGAYGGADSTGGTVVGNFAVPGKPVLGLSRQHLGGFAFDLSSTAADYKMLLGPGIKFCGILAPQRLVPRGLIVFDWAAQSILLCQGDKCRRSLNLPVNCPMYQFNGRPYFNASVSDGAERLFLIDTGATLSSADLNYFATPPATTTVNSEVSGAGGKKTRTSVLATAKLAFCGLGFNIKPFPVRGSSRSWEWAENGKLGMNSLFEGLFMLDFGQGMGLMK